MDIIRINNGLTGEGELLKEINNIMWVERYLEASEFSIKCPATEYFRTKLAPGSFISHTNTDEVMVVETQIIDETKEGNLELEVSGRSIEAVLMENRIISGNYNAATVAGGRVLYRYNGVSVTGNPSEPTYAFRPSSWIAAEKIIKAYCTDSASNREGVNNLVYEEIISPRTNYDDPDPTKYKIIPNPLDNVYNVVLNLLGSTNSGIKGIRVLAPEAGTSNIFKFQVHQGESRVGYEMGEPVTFSMSTGDLESVRYLWQFNPNIFTHVSSSEQYSLGYSFPTSSMTAPATYPSGIPSDSYRWGVKVVTYDSGDLSSIHTTPATINELEDVYSILQGDSKISINIEQKINIIDAKVSKNSKYKYKIDYNIGDLVWVAGNYEAASIMRVTEHAQILDETGESSIPTLSPW